MPSLDDLVDTYDIETKEQERVDTIKFKKTVTSLLSREFLDSTDFTFKPYAATFMYRGTSIQIVYTCGLWQIYREGRLDTTTENLKPGVLNLMSRIKKESK